MTEFSGKSPLPPQDAEALGKLSDTVNTQFEYLEKQTPDPNGLLLDGYSAMTRVEGFTEASILPEDFREAVPFTHDEVITFDMSHSSSPLASGLILDFQRDARNYLHFTHAFNFVTRELRDTSYNSAVTDDAALPIGEDTVYHLLDTIFKNNEVYTIARRGALPIADLFKVALRHMQFSPQTSQNMQFSKSEEHASKLASLTRHFSLKAMVTNRLNLETNESTTKLTLQRPLRLSGEGYTTTNTHIQTLSMTRDWLGEVTEASQEVEVILGGAETDTGRFLASKHLGITEQDYAHYLQVSTIPEAADAELFSTILTKRLTANDIWL